MKTSLIHWTMPTAERKDAEGESKGKVACGKRTLLNRVRAFFERVAPLGYQDEHGFHYGEQNHPFE